MNTQLIDELTSLLGDRFTVSDYDRHQHGKDESSLPPMVPDAVCFPHSTEEVAEIVGLCYLHQTPIIPFGAGSSLEGHVLAVHGGVTVDLSRMDKILRVSPDDLDCTVQAGVTRQQLNHHLRQQGLFFPIDPGAEATFGGMASTRASGTTAVRYGTMANNVLALTVVLPGGEVIKTGSRARKSSAGFDLTHLFVGAEGTLGIITEVTLRLQGVPEAICSAVVGFDELESAVKAVTEIRQVGIPVARIEFLDEVMVQAVNQFSNLGLVERPTLFLEFHGTDAAVKESAEMSAEITHDWGGSDFQWALDTAERNALWKARHNAYFAGLAFRPGTRALTTDVCVPISRLAECIGETKKDVNRSSLTAPMIGHVGDGNFHMMIMANPDNPAELEAAKQLHERLVERALAMGGTITGEHGVGLGKMKFMKAEHGNALSLMHTIKQAVDPKNLMNPGKMLPPL